MPLEDWAPRHLRMLKSRIDVIGSSLAASSRNEMAGKRASMCWSKSLSWGLRCLSKGDTDIAMFHRVLGVASAVLVISVKTTSSKRDVKHEDQDDVLFTKLEGKACI